MYVGGIELPSCSLKCRVERLFLALSGDVPLFTQFSVVNPNRSWHKPGCFDKVLISSSAHQEFLALSGEFDNLHPAFLIPGSTMIRQIKAQQEEFQRLSVEK